MSQADNAAIMFSDGYNCSQAVLLAFAPQYGLDRETAQRIAAAFGGGLGRQGLVCGAVSGAAIVLGFMENTPITDNHALTERTYARLQQFMEKFKASNGSILCRELLGYDVSAPAELQQAKAKGLFITRCPVFVSNAVTILEELR